MPLLLSLELMKFLCFCVKVMCVSMRVAELVDDTCVFVLELTLTLGIYTKNRVSCDHVCFHSLWLFCTDARAFTYS